VITLQGIHSTSNRRWSPRRGVRRADQTQRELAKRRNVLRATPAQYRVGVTTLPCCSTPVGITQGWTDEVTAVYTVRQASSALFAEGATAAG